MYRKVSKVTKKAKGTHAADHDHLKDVSKTVEETVETTEANVTENATEEVVEAVEVSELDLVKTELAAKNDALLRTIAEYSNYRKRVEKEKQDLLKYGNEKIMTDLLQLMDNFERALSSIDRENEALLPVISGVEMIKKSFDELMTKYGITELEALGETFNPEAHHAVMTGESEGAESNTVIEIFQKGYKLHEKVIRPAMVKVSE